LHNAVKPVSTAKNNSNNGHKPSRARFKSSIIHSQNTNFRLNYAKLFASQNFPSSIAKEHRRKLIISFSEKLTPKVKFKTSENANLNQHRKSNVKEMDKMETVSTFLIALGALLVIHHVIFWQRPFDVSDMLHHEFFEAIFFTAGITLLIAKHLNKPRSAGK
jgi:hypothetical protein